MINDLLDFLKNPDYKVFEGLNLKEKLRALLQLLALALVLSFSFGMLISLLENFAGLDIGEHAINMLFDEFSPAVIFTMVVILAPLLEELIFRGPLYFFRNSPHFKLIFYLLTLIFAFYHLTNFDITPIILILSPLLVSPQLVIGLLLGYIRVRLGLIWAILLHSAYNLVLIGPLILIDYLEMPLP